MVTVGTVGGGPVGCGPGSGLSQVTQSKSPTPATRRNILIKVRSASGYFRLLGWCVGSLPFNAFHTQTLERARSQRYEWRITAGLRRGSACSPADLQGSRLRVPSP